MTDHTHSKNGAQNKIDIDHLRFNDRHYLRAKRSLCTSDGKEIRLRAKTCQVFELLASAANEVVPREELISQVWGDVVVTDDTLSQSIREIRLALGDADRKILETLPRHGYLLHAIEIPASKVEKPSQAQRNWLRPLPVAVAAALLLICGIYLLTINFHKPKSQTPIAESESQVVTSTGEEIPKRKNIIVSVEIVGQGSETTQEQMGRSVVTSLSRYSSIEPTTSSDPSSDYFLELSLLEEDASSINLQLHHAKSKKLLVAENFVQTSSSNTTAIADRIAGFVGSPAGGAIGQHLLETARTKPVDELSRPECLAHGYGCTSCSGEFDSITPRAVQCLANLLEDDAEDPDAWALQSTVYSRQYLWGSALQEPMRTNKSKRSHLQSKAIETATRADALGNGNNPSVYWGMVQAYLASCDGDKMEIAVNRGLKLNPGDVNTLAVYGNFLSYAGKWDEGKALVEKALKDEPRYFKKWWYMSLAKWHYRQGDYQTAYELFNKSFNERNWLSHIQLAYTLPHLGRIEEAKQALQGFMRVAPSMTREHVYEFYRSYCFDDDFLGRMKTAFDLIDMPSRGSGDNFTDIQPFSANVEKIGDRMVEYVDVGSGVPLVFVHGSISDYRTWGYMLLPVSEQHRFLSLSLRYFGTLDWPPEKLHFDKNVDAQDVIDFIEHKQLGPVYLVGWSRSGSINSLVATLRPDLVKGLILYEPTLMELLNSEENPSPPPKSEFVDFSKVTSLLAERDEDAAVIEFFERALDRQTGEFKAEPSMLQRVVLDNARTLPLNFGEHGPNQPYVDCEFINKLEMPGLILYGENTNRPWQYMSTRFADCLKTGHASVVKNANHDGPLSQPQQIADYIIEFVQETQLGKPSDATR